METITDNDKKKFFEDHGYGLHSCFHLWTLNKIGNFGSFQTLIFQAFKIADSGNRKALCLAYPYWFIYPYKGAF